MTRPMEVLAQGAARLGVHLTQSQLGQFETYYQELSRWNRKVNLTAITAYDEVQTKHFLDSLTACLAFEGGLPSGSRVIDVGTGAGFPGLPLKLAFPDIILALADSVGKKTSFLKHLLNVLGVDDVKVYTGRAEELGHWSTLREGFDLAVSRGVAKLPTLLEYTLPLCAVGGKAMSWKHTGIQQELSYARRAINVLGGKPPSLVPVEAPGLTDGRLLVVVDKTRPTPEQYPRRPGVPAKRPL